MHSFGRGQLGMVIPRHVPVPLQKSWSVHALLSLHIVVFGAAIGWHESTASLQTLGRHVVPPEQVRGVPVQLPAPSHASLIVQ